MHEAGKIIFLKRPFCKKQFIFTATNFIMKSIAYLLIASIVYQPLQAQDTTYVKELPLGNTTMKVVTTCYIPCSSKVLFLNVHENERTSVKAASDYLIDNGGTIVHLQHSGERNLTFMLNDTTYIVDPNRMYSKKGLQASLNNLSTYNANADSAIQTVADKILQLVDENNLVVALHNNTDKNFSIADYKKGGAEAKNAALLYINPAMDADDFILTTERSIYQQIKDKKISVVLQDNKRVIDDGSLSVYAGKNKKPYINIEAQEGHRDEQLRMLEAISDIIKDYAEE